MGREGCSVATLCTTSAIRTHLARGALVYLTTSTHSLNVATLATGTIQTRDVPGALLVASNVVQERRMSSTPSLNSATPACSPVTPPTAMESWLTVFISLTVIRTLLVSRTRRWAR